MHSRFFVPLCLMLLLLSACSVKYVTVVDEQKFEQMVRRMPKELQARRILDSDESWLSAFALPGGEYGETLFKRLSPSFMFGDSGHVYLGETFSATLQAQSRVQQRSNGFSIHHPTQKIDLDMVAIVDWNDDGEKEWLLSCFVEPQRGGRTRTYYVLVPPPKNAEEKLQGTVAAVYECFGLACSLYVRDSKNIARTAANPLIPPTEVQDLTPGLQPVTRPPDKTPLNRDSVLKERNL